MCTACLSSIKPFDNDGHKQPERDKTSYENVNQIPLGVIRPFDSAQEGSWCLNKSPKKSKAFMVSKKQTETPHYQERDADSPQKFPGALSVPPYPIHNSKADPFAEDLYAFPACVLVPVIRFIGAPSFVQIDFSCFKFNFDGLVCRLRVPELLVIHPQRSRESHLKVLCAWASGVQEIVIHHRALEECIVELTAGEGRSI